MNIIIIEDSSKTWFGGGQKVTVETVRVLKEQYKLILFDCTSNSRFFDESKGFFSDIFLLKCYGNIIGGEKSSFSIGLKEILISFFISLFNLYSISGFLKKRSLNHKNTVIYTATKKGLLLSFFLKVIFKIRYIFHAHSYDDKKSLFYKIIKIPLKYSDKIICVSDTVKNNIDLPQCRTVYNPITAGRNSPKKINGRIIVASFSNLFKWKGIEYFMQSYDLLLNKDKVEYWIYGDGKEKEYLSRYQSSNVILKGHANNVDDLMMNCISMIIVPSISLEACPMVPLEAFSYGIPVIATNIGGQAEVVKDGYAGYHVPVKDPGAIAEKIDFLVDNAETYHQMSKNALEYSGEFDVKNFHENILDIIESFKNN
ncbi:MAG TPA: glycosyltransferase family 4 protein [Candidatus Brocadiaceae bacterium]